MKETMISETEQTAYDGPLKLNAHEKIIHNYVIKPEDISISMDDIKGLSQAKQMLQQLVVKPLKQNKHKKLNPPNGIILYGPPGTGKTMLVKALCKKMNVNFISFEQSFIEQKMFGESAKMVKALFTLAEKLKPCVIFIDELDGMFSERTVFDQSFVTGIKTQMLMHLDGFIERDPSVLFIGATNRLHSIDSALRRRMRTNIEIPLPNSSDREEIFKSYLQFDNIEYEKLAEHTEGFSGSDICEACKIAEYTTKADIIKTEDVINAINNCLSF